MAKKPLPTPEHVRQLVSYDPETGRFVWLPREVGRDGSLRSVNTFNAIYAGRPAFTIDHGNGYLSSTFFQVKAHAHRVAWVWMMGEWPDGEIDHINGDRSDNRWANLRLVTKSQNMRNAKLRSNNRSGHHGIYWDRSKRRWAATIKGDGRTLHLGRFVQLNDAVAARKAAEAKLGYHPNHGRS